ncbi:MAG TPA: tyrosine-type recombinase/integrase [Ktedonobacterales bacterium]|nr:tyrosine-type recombinase/integrase [Ktedonobacterales bacterium]
MLLADAIDDYLFESRKLSPTTYRWYAQKLRVFQQWCDGTGAPDSTDIGQLTTRDVRRFLDALAETHNPRRGSTLTPQTQHGYTQVIKQFLRWCGREGYCNPNLYDRIKLPKVEQPVFQTLTKEHITALFDACQHEVHPTLVARDRALLATLLSTGIRAAEACSLTLESLRLENPDDPHLVVRGKGKKWREVGLAYTAVRFLRRYLRVRTAHATVTALFTNQKGNALTPSGVNQLLYRLRDWAGIEDVPVSARQTRRAFAVHFMRQGGADVFRLKELMGHSDIQTTMIYLRDFQQKDARRGVNPLDTML